MDVTRHRDTDGPHRRHLAAVVGIAAALVVCTGVAACGTSDATSGGPSDGGGRTRSEGTVCASARSVDRLVVHRVGPLPGDRLRFPVPAEVTVTSARAVRTVAEAVCGLPAMPAGIFHCTVDLGVVQHLVFSAGTRVFPEVTASPGGCGIVRGAGPIRWGPGPVWTALGRALHLTPPYGPAFWGT